MDLYYVNNFGQTVDFVSWPYMVSESDLYDYTWQYESKNSVNPKVSRFYRENVEKKLKISVSATSLSAYNDALMNLLEVTEKDVLNLTPGRLYVGREYLPCYILGSAKSNWSPGVQFLVNTFTVLSEGGSWIRENLTVFRPGSGGEESNTTSLDYPYDYPHDYASGIERRNLVNSGYHDTDFEITIYGSCQNPEINIGGHKYSVSCQLSTGEYLKINSMTKKIYKVEIDGGNVNQFHLRDRENYIFQKIRAGANTVTWSGLFGFDITLYEKRSEPRWT